MRLFEISDNSDFEKLKELITSRATEYTSSYSEWKTKPLYRGFDNVMATYEVLSTPKNRKPKDSPLALQELIDQIYSDAGIVAKRSNSIFCSFSKGTTEFYSTDTMVIIPLNGYHVSQITSIKDLYISLDSFFAKGLLLLADNNAKVFMRSDLYRVMEQLAGPKFSSSEFAELTNRYVELNKISYNDMVEIITKLYEFKDVKKAIKEFYLLIDDAYAWNKIIVGAGVKDNGLGDILKRDVVTDFSKMNRRSEVLLGDSEYIAVSLKFWKNFIQYIGA